MRKVATLAVIIYLVTSAVAHADPQGKWWIDPDSGTFSMVDTDSHIQVAGCTSASTLPAE